MNREDIERAVREEMASGRNLAGQVSSVQNMIIKVLREYSMPDADADAVSLVLAMAYFGRSPAIYPGVQKVFDRYMRNPDWARIIASLRHRDGA